MAKPTEEEFQALAEEIVAAAAAGNPGTLKEVLEEFESKTVRGRPPQDAAQKALDALRTGKHFKDLCFMADACLDAGLDLPFVRLQYAQGMIELGLLRQALGQLDRLRDKLGSGPGAERDKSEALGLMGRTHKQRFVRFGKDRERAAAELVASIGCYKEVYSLDPAWHGANMVALVHRAEREGISPGEQMRSEDVAAKVIRDLRDLPPEKVDFWTSASIGEASLALNDWDTAAKMYGDFAERADPFALAGAVRNLKEIWQIEPGGDNPAAKLLVALEAKTLSSGRGQIGYSPRDLARVTESLNQSIDQPDSTIEAILGDNPQVDLKTLLALIRTAPGVCQVVNRHLYAARRKSGGTGFLVDGGLFKDEWGGKPMLVTNNHVLSRLGDSPSVRQADADAVFHYWDQSEKEKAFAVKELVDESSREALDVALAFLEDPGGTLNDSRNWLTPGQDRGVLGRAGDKPPGKVYLIGHPDGRGLEFSLSDNTLIDHDLLDVDTGRPFHRIHYKAPTEKGMSGSPVFCQHGMQLIGLHRAGGAVAPLHPPPEGGDYRANEAVWIDSIRRWAAGE